MELILSQQCESLQGMLSGALGYAVQKRKNRYFGVRCNNKRVPPDGHWRFIAACAKLAQNKLYATDIRITRKELFSALWEAGHYIAAQSLQLNTYNARDILNLKTTFGL